MARYGLSFLLGFYNFSYLNKSSKNNFFSISKTAQFKELDYESEGEILDIATTFSTYDCINECIKNSFCYTATHLSKDKFNCYLKTKYDDKLTDPHSTIGQVFEIKGLK